MQIKYTNLLCKNNYLSYLTQETNFMNLDVGIIKLDQDQEYIISSDTREKALNLLQGKVKIQIYSHPQQEFIFNRANVFHDRPSVIHIDHKTSLKLIALSDNVELIFQATHNQKEFPYKIYQQDDLKITSAGINESKGTTERKIIEFFSYTTAPYSNMVMGEVICSPGSWASWPPHRHYQPEMYLFKFNRPEGFGVSFAGEEVYKVENNDAVCIPGQLLHPTVSAPCYLMWYCWMIPNLENKPWTERNYEEKYIWTTTNDCEISRME